jgi:exocyst complex component 2
MALEIVRLYITLISEFFSLSDKAVVAPSRDSIDLPSFIPQGSNSITTAFFVSRILSDISECVGDVTTAELASDATSGLKACLKVHVGGSKLLCAIYGYKVCPLLLC